MGMESYVKGIREEDEEFKRMAAVAMACHQAKCELPPSVSDYFKDGFDPLDPTRSLSVKIPFEGKSTSYSNIWEVEVSKIPKGVQKIRFENSY